MSTYEIKGRKYFIDEKKNVYNNKNIYLWQTRKRFIRNGALGGNSCSSILICIYVSYL